jgi:acyl-CoA-dependent ceramide synthase
MSDPSPIAATPNEKIEAERDVLYRNRDGIADVEHRINGGAAESFPPRTPILKRKAKRKDDGPLEIVCGWIVEHQIGMMKVPRIIQLRPLANGIQDWLSISSCFLP